MTKQWFAVYTRPQQEQKAAASLSKKGIETYCPITAFTQHSPIRKKNSNKALFPHLIFVCITEAQFSIVRKSESVINFMYWLNRPATIPESEITQLRQFINMSINLSIEKLPVNRNNVPVIHKEANLHYFAELNTSPRYKQQLLLPSLGYRVFSNAQWHYETVQTGPVLEKILAN